MGIAYLIVALLSAAATIFALQNVQPVSVRFLFWSIENVPLASAILVSLAAGVCLSGIPLTVERWRWRARAGSLETRLETLEREMRDRDASLATQRLRVPAREA